MDPQFNNPYPPNNTPIYPPPSYHTPGAPYPAGGNLYPPMPPGIYPPPAQPAPQYNWMPQPTVAGGLPGLAYLTTIDRLLVKQEVEILEVLTNVECPNRYLCYNSQNQLVYRCSEESSFYQQQMLRASRPFVMHIFDNAGIEVIRVNRPYSYTCCSSCCSCSECCQDEVQVESPVGFLIGSVKQVFKACSVRYEVRDAQGTAKLLIFGPSACVCECFQESIDFSVMSLDGSVEVGKISKQWSGTYQEMITNADNFGVSFPLDLDARMKAVLIGAVFLIDFMFFEQRQRKDD